MAEISNKNWINGQVRFSPNISLDTVLGLATEFKDSSEANKVKALAVRGCGVNEFGIIFAVEYDGTDKARKDFIYKLTDKLKRRFGNDVNWDISNRCWVIQ